MARWTAVLLLTVVGTVGLAGQSGAHTDLTASDPSDGATLSVAPSAITLTFNEPVQNFEPVIALTGPDGQPYPTGTPIVDSATVRSDVQAVGPAGTYTIAYRVVSVDGHPVTGQVQFQLAAAPEPAAAPPATTSSAVASPAATPPTTAAAPAVTGPATTSAATPTAGGGSTSLDRSTAAAAGLAASSTDESSGPSGWVWAALVGVAVLIAAAGVVIARQRRQHTLGDE